MSITGREVVERLTRFEEGQKHLEQRIEEVQGNLERRIEQLQANLEARIRELRDFMLWGFGVTFAGIFALIGFVLWDRRTALAPAVRRIDELHDRERLLEAALRDYANQSPGLADSLRKLGLL